MPEDADLEDELLSFVLAVAICPKGCVSDDLRRRAVELLELFDAEPTLRVVKSGKRYRRSGKTRTAG